MVDPRMIEVLELALQDNDRLLGLVVRNLKPNPDQREALNARRRMNSGIFKELRAQRKRKTR